jgi:hypothetical protein
MSTNEFNQAERRVVARLTSPARIQSFLDELAYNPGDDRYRCPLSVVREGLAHCFEAAVFGAAALRQTGYRPLIVNLFPEPGMDDEHLLAIYGEPGAWGAVAKSNYAGLRYREPIYRNLRELVISYFEHYYNLAKDRTLRSYSRPLNLAGFDRHDWLTEDSTMTLIEARLNAMKQIPLLTTSMIRGLCVVDERSYHSGLVGSNPDGLSPPPSRAARSRRRS